MVTKISKPIKNASPEIWTVDEAAEYLRMSEAKVYRLVRIGKAWRFRKDLLDNWLNECPESSMKKNGNSDSSKLKSW